MKFLAIVAFTFLVHYSFAKIVDYRVGRTPIAAATRNCTRAGPLCESCSTAVVCVDDGDGIWTKNQVETCKAPSYCVDGGCTTAYDPFCYGTADLAFPCKTVGIFPDPFYCNKFVLCVKSGTNNNLVHYLNTCEEGYGFNIETDLCDIKLDNGQCQDKVYPVPLCEEAGQSEALEGKSAMYYICEQYSTANTVLYPFLDVCLGGESYVDYTCGGTASNPTEDGPTTTLSP